MENRERKFLNSTLPWSVVLVSVVLVIIIVVNDKTSNESTGEGSTSSVAGTNAIAERAQSEDVRKRSGIRPDDEMISGSPTPARGALCVDGEGDGNSTSAAMSVDIDTAELFVKGNNLIVHINMFPSRNGGDQLSGGLKLTSVADEELWVSYFSANRIGGQRVGTDSKGDAKWSMFSAGLGDESDIELSVPLSDFEELGDELIWRASMSQWLGPNDECPNEGRELIFKLSELEILEN